MDEDEFNNVGELSYVPNPIQEGNLVSPIQDGALVASDIQEGTLVSPIQEGNLVSPIQEETPQKYDFPTLPRREEKESIILEQIPLLKKMFPESKFLFLFKDIKSNIKNVPMHDIDKFIDALTLFTEQQDTEIKKTLVRRMHSALSNTLKGGKSKTKTKKQKRRKPKKQTKKRKTRKL
jgi:hypothetical protein